MSEKFAEIASKQTEVVVPKTWWVTCEHDFSIRVSSTKISQFLLTDNVEDRKAAEYATRMEILAPHMHERFLEQWLRLDNAPFARSQSSTEYARKDSSEARREEDAQLTSERGWYTTRN